MSRHACQFGLVWTVLLLSVCVPLARAARPGASVLPNTTKGYLSIPDVDELRAKWNETQLGQLINDPTMQPFVKDLRRQLKEKLTQIAARVGMTWEDLDGVYAGEVCVAMIQPNYDKEDHAVTVLADVTGRQEEVGRLLAKIHETLVEKGATKTSRTVDETELIIYRLPKRKDQKRARKAVLFVVENHLVATDHEKVAEGILARFSGNPTDTLQSVPAFREAMARCRGAASEPGGHIRWFVEPFGCAEVMRAASERRRRRGTDMIKVLLNQGFGAIQGLGGTVSFATGRHELLHRTFAYAPPVKRDEGDTNTEKYNLAARMLDFPNHAKTVAESWVPRDLATYASFSWKVPEAFENCKSLVNEIADPKNPKDDLFEDVLDGIKDPNDPWGPQVDIRNELIAYLGERVTILSDYRLPITTKSERLLIAIESTNPQTLAATIDKFMSSDPSARKVKLNGHTIWEIVAEQEIELTVLEINGPGIVPLRPGVEEEANVEEDDRKPLFPNQAIAVARGYLIMASHIDFIKDVLKPESGRHPLSESVDYQLINSELTRLGAGQDSARFFSRTDEEYRPTYELISSGKMPESETLLGKLLNQLMGTGEEGVLREQRIDGKLLPDFQAVRRYLGPAGAYVRSGEDGWLVIGITLNKQAP